MLQDHYTTQEEKVLNVFKRHLTAFASGDLDEVLADFSEESVLVTQDGVYVGLEGARLVFGALLAEFGVIDRGDSPGFTIVVQNVHRDTLLITWHAESKNYVFPFGTDTFVCDGVKVLRLSIAHCPPIPRKAG